MTLTEAISEYLTSCCAEGKAVSTIGWYKRRLNRLLSFIGDVELEAIDVSDLRRFLVHLREKNVLFDTGSYRRPVEGRLSEHTIESFVRAIKCFFNWLYKEGYTASPIASRLKRPRLPKLPPKSASLADIQLLLKFVRQNRKSPFLAKRDYSIILFLVDTGCRVGGLVNLRVCDLDLEGRSALVTEKGNKSRFVFFSNQTQQALRDWLLVRSARFDGSDFVFVGERGPLTPFGVSQMLSKLKKRAGISGRVNPHSFRHHFAKSYLLNGGDLASLSDIMGHSDVVVTKNSYSVFLKEELQRKHDQYSPLSVRSENENL